MFAGRRIWLLLAMLQQSTFRTPTCCKASGAQPRTGSHDMESRQQPLSRTLNSTLTTISVDFANMLSDTGNLGIHTSAQQAPASLLHGSPYPNATTQRTQPGPGAVADTAHQVCAQMHVRVRYGARSHFPYS